MSTPTAEPGTLTAVVIDDNRAHLDLMCHAISSASTDESPVRIAQYENADVALANLPAEGDVVIVCDYRLGHSSGIDWLPDFLRANVGPVIIVTSSGDERIAADAFRQGAADYISKTVAFDHPDRLLAAMRESLRRFRLDSRNRELSRQLKVANTELQRKNEVLAEMTDTAHRFVDDVAHEFRTPLAVIKEFASIISDGIGGDVTEKQAEFLRFIIDASRDLAHLIDDFLDSGKLRAQTLRVDRQPMTVESLLDSCWPMLDCRAATKDLTLEREIAPNLPRVFADADKARRSLINLMINAIKFSGTGDTVRVTVAPDENGGVRVSVTDRGPGLPEEEVAQLFQRFRQGTTSSRTSSKGFGLGLNIVKELVAVNLGTVDVRSEQGVGSTFSFTLPPYQYDRIIDALLRRTRERAPSTFMTALRVSRKQPETSLDDLRSFVASVSQATDVVLPARDGNAVIVISEATDIAAWQQRLADQDLDHRRHLPDDSVGALEMTPLGTWTLGEAAAALHAIFEPPAMERRCA